MPFKKDEKGLLVVGEDGFPIFVGSDGVEKPYDVDARIKQIAELTEKSSRRGQELDELKTKYKALEGIDDLAAYVAKAKKDAETVAAMADKDREAEATIQKRITEAIKGAVTPLESERDNLKAELAKIQAELNNAVISNAFAHSKFAIEKTVSPALAQQLFGGSFYLKDGKPVGRDSEGKDIYGIDGLANFDEALQKLIETSPFRENILKQSPGGGDSKRNENQPRPGDLSAEQVGKLSPQEYIKARKEGRI